MSPSLRRAGPDDLDAIAPLMAGFHEEEARRPGSFITPMKPEDLRKWLAAALGSAEYHYYAIIDDGTIVGFLNVSRISDDHWEWLSIYVHPAHRGQGIARWAVTRVVEELKVLGVKRVSLQIAADNFASLGLFAKVLGPLVPTQVIYQSILG